jgi:hypothetical protein
MQELTTLPRRARPDILHSDVKLSPEREAPPRPAAILARLCRRLPVASVASSCLGDISAGSMSSFLSNDPSERRACRVRSSWSSELIGAANRAVAAPRSCSLPQPENSNRQQPHKELSKAGLAEVQTRQKHDTCLKIDLFYYQNFSLVPLCSSPRWFRRVPKIIFDLAPSWAVLS